MYAVNSPSQAPPPHPTQTHTPTSITHSRSLSRKLGEGRTVAQPPMHVTNIHNKTHSPQHTDYPPMSIKYQTHHHFNPFGNTVKPWVWLTVNPNLLVEEQAKRTHNMYIKIYISAYEFCCSLEYFSRQLFIKSHPTRVSYI